MKFAIATIVVLVALPFASAAEKDAWYAKAVKGVAATVEPAEAKPGQTVTMKLTIDLNDGYFTYPTKQPDENAKSFVNKIAFPKPGTLVFVGEVADPKGFLVREELALGILELRTYKGSVAFERKAVVSPKAKPGDATVTMESFKLNVCDAKNCFDPKTLRPEMKLKVLEGSVEVAKEYADEVSKAEKSSDK